MADKVQQEKELEPGAEPETAVEPAPVEVAKAPSKVKAPSRYKVLNWHQAVGDFDVSLPCSIDYVAGGVERHAVTGDIVDDLPVGSVGKPGQEDIRSYIIGTHIALVED